VELVGEEKITLVHLSDLHLSTEDAKETFEILETEIKGLRPDIIIVTGDLIDSPKFDSLVEVKNKLIKLCDDCGIVDTLVVIPGNHDYRWFGFLNLWEKVYKKSFLKVFPEWKTPKLFEIKGKYFAVFPFDSNENVPSINAARGRVGNDELVNFLENLQLLKIRYGYSNAYKIAIVHHHPIPIADTEINKYKGDANL
jgi:predicted MPP superfamily phosphohydrolase